MGRSKVTKLTLVWNNWSDDETVEIKSHEIAIQIQSALLPYGVIAVKVYIEQ